MKIIKQEIQFEESLVSAQRKGVLKPLKMRCKINASKF